MILAENEVAHAGIGADLHVSGLESLVKASSLLGKLRTNAERLHDITTNITTRITNKPEVDHFQSEMEKLRHGSNADINIHTNGEGQLNRMRDSLNQTRSSVNNLKKSMDINTHISMSGNSGISHLESGVRRLNSSMGQARESGNRLASTGDKIHGIFSGTFIGNAASQAFSAMASGAKSAIASGIKLVSVGRDTQRAWRNVGLNSNSADKMTEQMDNIRDKAGMDEQSINMMQKSFYSLTGSAPKAQSLTNEIVSFGKATGESDQALSRMGRTLPRMLSTGKVSGQMFNRTFRQSPALINAIAKASGHSTAQFRQMASNGKITSQQLMQYMEKAAKGSGRAWKEYANTFQGQLNVIRGTWTKAKENFTRPFVSNLTKAINQATKSGGGLLKVQQAAGKLSATLGRRVGNFTGKAIGWIVKNQKPLISIGSSLFRIISAIASGVWKEFTSVLTGITGGTKKSGRGLNNMAKSLSRLASHTKQLQKFGKVMLNIWAISKLNKFTGGLKKLFPALKKTGAQIQKNSRQSKGISVFTRLQNSLNKSWERSGHTTARLYMNLSKLRHPIIQTKMSAHNLGLTLKNTWRSGISHVKSYGHQLTWANLKQKMARMGNLTLRTSITSLSTATKMFGFALDSIPIVGWIQLAIDGITEIYMHSAKFRRLVNPLLRFVGNAIGKIGDLIADGVGEVIKFAKGIGHLASKVTGFFNHTKVHAASTSSSMNRYTRNSSRVYRKGQRSNTSATKHSHSAIDKYRKNSSGKFRAYISKNGKLYKTYHKGTTRISETTYKQREALRRRYYTRYESSLRKYERNYKRYENKRSSLSRKYGKLRAMYSVKSLDLIEKRFKKLKNMVVGYAKKMYHDTQRWFKKLGTGAGKQFQGIYKDIKRWLGRGNRTAVRDFKTLQRNSRKYLNGSVKSYVKELRYRYKRQRYYDRQLVKQSKRTNRAMYKLPLGWIGKETKMLIRDWRSQRRSFITHNRRMTKAERTHLNTMTKHLKTFGKNFKSIMNDLEGSIYDHWSKFWTKMHNRAGSGINSVQRPLNTGAEHINSFVRAFGETSSPMSEMPTVSYATGTLPMNEIRRPITRLTNAVLNDGSDSPETNNQETIIHPNGQMEFPQGNNVHRMLEPGAEVLNATETKLMGEMAHFAPTVHLASGTGLFSSLFSKFTGWIKSALSGSNSGNTYDSIYSQAKGSGDHKLLHVLQHVLSHSEQVLSGFMGNAPSGIKGVIGDITQGIYGQTANQIDAWWKALMNLTDQTLNSGGASGPILKFAEKFGQGKRYVWGGTGAGGGYDCSGFVQAVLRHYGVNAPRVSGAQINAFPHISRSNAQPGDLVGNSGHIGIVADKGAHYYYSMFNPSVGAKLYPLDSAHWDGNPTMTFARVPKLAHMQDSDNGPSFKGASKGLMAFVKNQEKPYFKWIEKHLVPLLNPDPGGGPGVAKWRPIIKQAAERMHVNLSSSGLNKILSNIQHESNGDENVTNHWDSNAQAGHASTGLVQFIPSTFEHYAVSGHDNIHSGYDQLLALFNDSSWYSDIAPGGGWGPTGSRRLATGGHLRAGEMATVGEEGAELFKPDVSGTVIPSNDSQHIINNNHKPISVHNTINVHVSGGDKSTTKVTSRATEKGVNEAMENWIEKMNRLVGNTKGGLVY